jgi:epoxyqueuosine reductase
MVLALAHGVAQPKLDWWGVPGGTHGNRKLQATAEALKVWLAETLKIQAQLLPYQPEEQGIFLKDAAALAGLGVIGANNLLITPDYGPRIRLRGLLMDIELEPTRPVDFSPCETCDRLCWHACPQAAFASGAYDVERCRRQMQTDEANRYPETGADGLPVLYVKYCRACELSCPA